MNKFYLFLLLKDVETILKKIVNGEMNREIDEKGSGGFWDLALQISTDRAEKPNEVAFADIKETEKIYNALWNFAETILEV